MGSVAAPGAALPSPTTTIVPVYDVYGRPRGFNFGCGGGAKLPDGTRFNFGGGGGVYIGHEGDDYTNNDNIEPGAQTEAHQLTLSQKDIDFFKQKIMREVDWAAVDSSRYGGRDAVDSTSGSATEDINVSGRCIPVSALIGTERCLQACLPSTLPLKPPNDRIIQGPMALLHCICDPSNFPVVVGTVVSTGMPPLVPDLRIEIRTINKLVNYQRPFIYQSNSGSSSISEDSKTFPLFGSSSTQGLRSSAAVQQVFSGAVRLFLARLAALGKVHRQIQPDLCSFLYTLKEVLLDNTTASFASPRDAAAGSPPEGWRHIVLSNWKAAPSYCVEAKLPFGLWGLPALEPGKCRSSQFPYTVAAEQFPQLQLQAQRQQKQSLQQDKLGLQPDGTGVFNEASPGGKYELCVHSSSPQSPMLHLHMRQGHYGNGRSWSKSLSLELLENFLGGPAECFLAAVNNATNAPAFLRQLLALSHCLGHNRKKSSPLACQALCSNSTVTPREPQRRKAGERRRSAPLATGRRGHRCLAVYRVIGKECLDVCVNPIVALLSFGTLAIGTCVAAGLTNSTGGHLPGHVHYFQGLRYRLSQTISADLQMSPSPLAGDVNISAGASLIAWRKWKTAAMAVGDVTETLEQLLPRLLPIQAWDPSSSPPTTHSSNSSTSTAIIPCNNVSSVVHTSSTSKARGESGECPAAPPSYHGIRLLSSTFASLLLEAAESFQNLHAMHMAGKYSFGLSFGLPHLCRSSGTTCVREVFRLRTFYGVCLEVRLPPAVSWVAATAMGRLVSGSCTNVSHYRDGKLPVMRRLTSLSQIIAGEFGGQMEITVYEEQSSTRTSANRKYAKQARLSKYLKEEAWSSNTNPAENEETKKRDVNQNNCVMKHPNGQGPLENRVSLDPNPGIKTYQDRNRSDANAVKYSRPKPPDSMVAEYIDFSQVVDNANTLIHFLDTCMTQTKQVASLCIAQGLRLFFEKQEHILDWLDVPQDASGSPDSWWHYGLSLGPCADFQVQTKMAALLPAPFSEGKCPQLVGQQQPNPPTHPFTIGPTPVTVLSYGQQPMYLAFSVIHTKYIYIHSRSIPACKRLFSRSAVETVKSKATTAFPSGT
eukprot:GHVT01033830.1.p1 GENE.GHVT01033830.1~~GHVT01033830.1.p1  ORF type:complete len:1101 (-),score=115.01 GHVT01033830.1:1182-4484(-)